MSRHTRELVKSLAYDIQSLLGSDCLMNESFVRCLNKSIGDAILVLGTLQNQTTTYEELQKHTGLTATQVHALVHSLKDGGLNIEIKYYRHGGKGRSKAQITYTRSTDA